MKAFVFMALIWGSFLPCKAQFFDKLVDKAADAAGNALEKKVEKKSTEYTEKATDVVFDPIDGKSGKKEKKGMKKKTESDETSHSEKKNVTSNENSILITQGIFVKNSLELTTNKIPDLDKAGYYLADNPNTRTTIIAHVQADEDAEGLSEHRAMLIKTILVRKFELNEDFISIETSKPDSPNDRYVEINFKN